VVVGQKVVSAHWNRQEGKKYNLYTYTNADEVELLINGKSIGKQTNSMDVRKRNTIYWKDILYTAGTITAIARKAGKEVARHQLETTGPAVALQIETENANWQANGMDLQHLKVYAIDSKGRKVATADAELNFNISGAANLIALDNGNHLSNDLFAGNKKRLHNGFALAILRAGQTPGSVTISITGAGLKPAELVLQVK
jgi:beta-galactosidase